MLTQQLCYDFVVQKGCGMWQVRRALPCNHAEILYPCKGLYRGGASCDEDGEERDTFNDSIVAFLAKKERTRVWFKRTGTVLLPSSVIVFNFHR